LENRDLALTAFALQKGYSLVLMKEGKLIAAKQGRGIRPLLELIEEDKGQLQGAYLGDKIFGRAAAFLAAFILMRSGEKFYIPRTSLMDMFLRCSIGTMGILCNFWAVDHMRIADANILNKLSPFFAILMSIFIRLESTSCPASQARETLCPQYRQLCTLHRITTAHTRFPPEQA